MPDLSFSGHHSNPLQKRKCVTSIEPKPVMKNAYLQWGGNAVVPERGRLRSRPTGNAVGQAVVGDCCVVLHPSRVVPLIGKINRVSCA